MEDKTMKKILSAAVLMASLVSGGFCYAAETSFQDYVTKMNREAHKTDSGISAAEREKMKDRAAHSPRVSYPMINHKGTYSQAK
jgi:hypothetical protein